MNLSITVWMAVALLGACPAYATPPANDDYLAATALNTPGSPMPRDTVTTPATDTSEAGLQADLLSPPSNGGPPEPSACGATGLDRTVWYRFFPDVDGRMKLQAVGFDATLALVPFTSVARATAAGLHLHQPARRHRSRRSTRRSRPAPATPCRSAAPRAPAGYCRSASRSWPDRDGDGVTDDDDRCPRRPGTANGCPPRIVAAIAYKYDGAPNGARFRYLDVRGAPSGAGIDIRCSRGCRRQRLTVRSRVTHVKAFRGTPDAGRSARSRCESPSAAYIGAYRKFTVSVGDVTTTDGCLQPGSTVPSNSCT